MDQVRLHFGYDIMQMTGRQNKLFPVIRRLILIFPTTCFAIFSLFVK